MSTQHHRDWFGVTPSLMDGSQTVREQIRELLSHNAQHIEQKRIIVDVDVDTVEHRLVSPQLSQALADLFRLVLDRSPEEGDLLITAVENEDGIEVELADSGDDPPAENGRPSLAAFRSAEADSATLAGLAIDCNKPNDFQLHCSRCPQGGLAWTLRPRKTARALKVA